MKLSQISRALEKLKEQDRLRIPDDSLERDRLAAQFGSRFVDAATNDYLGLGARFHVARETARPTEVTDVARETGSTAQGSDVPTEAGQPMEGSDAADETRQPTEDSDAADETGQPTEGSDVARETEARSNTRTPAQEPTELTSSGKASSAPLPATESGVRQCSSAPGIHPLESSLEVRAGAGASRLIYGSAPEHLEVERMLASWMGHEGALLFSSGYAANVGALGALLSAEDAVFSDALNHASLIDGIRLSRASATVYSHLDCDELERKLAGAQDRAARWVVTESYFSMDGDAPDLPRLRALCDRYDAHLYVDEAHSVGIFGRRGAGLCQEKGVRADVLMAAFGKAVGSHGACVLGSRELRTWLWNRARSFVFSTAPSPLQTRALALQIRAVQEAQAERDELLSFCVWIRDELRKQGLTLLDSSFGPILSIQLGGERRALDTAKNLRAQGILAQAIRPPTVPEGESRLRLCLRAGLSKEQKKHLIENVPRETLKEKS